MHWRKVIQLFVVASLGTMAATLNAQAEPLFETKSLLANGTFDKVDPPKEGSAPEPVYPALWSLEEPAGAPEVWAQDKTVFLQGGASLRMAGGRGNVTVAASPIALDKDFIELSALVMGKGEGGSAKVRWLARNGSVLREDAFRSAPPPTPDAWTRFSLADTEPPKGAERVVVVLSAAPAEGAAYWWDGAELTGNYEHQPEAVILINQAGYELTAPKNFVVSANFQAKTPTFDVISQDGRVAFKGELKNGEPIHGEKAADWGRYFYRGDFTDMDAEGTYSLRVAFGPLILTSPGFVVQFDRLWEETLNKAVTAITAGRGVSGGPLWADPGAPPLSEAEQFWYLATDYKVLQWRWGMEKAVGPLREESRWAARTMAERLAKGVAETSMNNDDLARCAAALGVVARDEKDNAPLVAATMTVTELLRTRNHAGPYSFAAAWHLYMLTQDPAWKEQAIAWFPGIQIEVVEELLDYDMLGPGSVQPLTLEVGVAMQQVSETLLKGANNPFGVYASGEGGSSRFFLSATTDKASLNCGNTHRVLMAAELMARAYRFAARPEYLAFIYDQLNWVLGVNPFGVCLMEGVGNTHVSSVIHPKSAERPSLTGLILNGVGARGPDDDRPYLALNPDEEATAATNGFALRNNIRYVNTLSYLKRIRVVLPGEKK